ncbi:hypothetical protein [Aliiroseovarius lamellibrachiae]|uniref:hypothetical protein n=1 Tax=Aliiroseovarius lamellibrachiae TaxID=1924933 RepID=UPI001BDFA870|nr:hypothetical protein [Aliiroseovarius lamellibrachiae]MBT2131225.1 hypothetical protein [Aliiroseovarius lamellibrachiae]
MTIKNQKQEYRVKAAGPVAGTRRKEGEIVSLTAAQAKYENVTLVKDEGARVEIVGSLDDPTVKATGLAGNAKTETAKRGRAKK